MAATLTLALCRARQREFASDLMLEFFRTANPLVVLVIATVCEVSGDAIVRMGIFNHAGVARVGVLLGGGLLLFCYGFLLNLAPLDFGRVVGLYIATLFVVWQVINFVTFRTAPALPVIVGGALIIAGGLIVSFWQPRG